MKVLDTPPTTTPVLKLNLGCCDRAIPGYVGVDITAGPYVDQEADLNQRWPWPDSSVDEILAFDIIEHLRDARFTMNEAYRVLKPGGQFHICVPTTDGRGAFQDPTHITFWNRNSFWYYEAGNPYRERFARSYGIVARFLVKEEKNETTIDGPKLTIVLEKPID
jgi:SAM-dependent methyltransferase